MKVVLDRANLIDKLKQEMLNSIPYLKADQLPVDEPEDDADLCFDWLLPYLGDSFVAYVEWKEWDSFIEETVDSLTVLESANAKIDIDELDRYVQVRLPPLFNATRWFLDWERHYLIGMNVQLAKFDLRLINIGLNENPYLICARNDDNALNELSKAFEALQIEVDLAKPKNRDLR